ncbi:transposase [Priestia megaterium]
MNLQSFYQDWTLLSYKINPSDIQLYLQAHQTSKPCPSCHTLSSRVHSRYWRAIKDISILSLSVHLHVRSRKFFCDNTSCDQRIFTERQEKWWLPYARRTNRLSSFLKQLGFTLSAETAHKVSVSYGTPISPDSFLYLIRKEELPSIGSPKIVGIDDWALRKRHRYGSIICNLQTRKPIALLPSRTVEEVSEWLKAHPSIKIITRDGSIEFAKGIREGCPSAIQITDRWHLFHNLSQKVEQYIKRLFPHQIRLSYRLKRIEEKVDSLRSLPSLTEGEKKKWALIQRVQARYKDGCKKADVIREFSIDRKTLNKYLQLTCPPKIIKASFHSADPYRSTIVNLLQKRATIPHIFSVIKQQGYDRSFSTLSDYITKLKRKRKQNVSVTKVHVSKLKLQAYLWSRLTPTRKDRFIFDRLFKVHKSFYQLKRIIQGFQHLIYHQKNEQSLMDWLSNAQKSNINEIKQFAAYIKTDIEAVKHALFYSWSNGIVEGNVNRLKVIKRQMYGRAKLDLLSKKVLYQFP